MIGGGSEGRGAGGVMRGTYVEMAGRVQKKE